MPEERQAGLLRSGDIELSVQLMDESATGYSIEVPGQPPLQPNDVVQLRTYSGWWEVRVARIESCDDSTNIGVVRLRDIRELNQPPQIHVPLWKRFLAWLRALIHQPNVAIACVAIALVLILFGAKGYSLFWSADVRPQVPQQFAKVKEPTSEAVVEERRQEVFDAKVQMLRELESSPELAAELELTQEQQAEIHRKVPPVLEAIERDDLSLEEKARLVEQVSLEVLSLLTPEQTTKYLRHGSPTAQTGHGTISGRKRPRGARWPSARATGRHWSWKWTGSGHTRTGRCVGARPGRWTGV